MTPKNTKTGRIRTLLRDMGKAMPAQEIADRLGIDADYIRVMLAAMPDTYIERWDRTKTGRGWLAVWNVAHVPPDAMRPKSAAVELRIYDAQYRERKRYAKRKAEKAAMLAAMPSIEPAAPAEPTTPAPKTTEPTTSAPKTRWVTPPPWAN